MTLPFTSGQAFSILDPVDNSTYQSNETINVKVDLGEVGGIHEVRYYWYGEQEDMLEEFVEQKLALISTQSNHPPFGGPLTIPSTILGNFRLLAVAVPKAGRLTRDNWSIFDEVLIHVEPPNALQNIDFETDKPLRFGRAGSAVVYDQVDFLGKVFALSVVGHFSDGIVRSIRLKDTGTTYESSNPSVVTIGPNGLLRLIGNGQAIIHVQNHGKQAMLDVVVEVKDEPNEPPIPDPGPNQVVQAGSLVKLNALGSYDPEGKSLEYSWSQVRGSNVPLLDPFSAKASFLAPFVVGERIFRFKLRVTDAQGADSLPAFLDVTVQP
ncbi:MAG: hypothetical protein GKS05_00725 [Nitrospirales bacterium]|nr:hypothetical protein [Nitrospirales bacterium]